VWRCRISFLFHGYDAKDGKAVGDEPARLATLVDNEKSNVMATGLPALFAMPRA
jgi:hypothetical protein